MKAEQFTKRAEKKGWIFYRQSGSHKIYKHPDFKDNLSIPDHGKEDIPIGTLRALARKAGLKWPLK